MAKDGMFFKTTEFTCKCGCGQNKVKQELIALCDLIRAEADVPLIVTSGTRCPTNNKRAGGVANSNHLTGEAADLKPTSGMSADTLHKIVLKLWRNKRLPMLAGLGVYKTWIHVDINPRKEHLRQWDER